MATPLKCDNDTNLAAWTIGDVATGVQLFLCGDCYKSGGRATTSEATPEVCQLCEVEPVTMIVRNVSVDEATALGQRCYLAMTRGAWLMHDAEDYETLDEMAHQLAGLTPEAPKPKRGRRKGVAVDEPSSPRLAVVEDEGQDPRSDVADIDAAIHADHTGTA